MQSTPPSSKPKLKEKKDTLKNLKQCESEKEIEIKKYLNDKTTNLIVK